MLYRQRNGGIEYLRFIGAIAIVYFHRSLPGSEFALSALPIFVLLSIYYGYGRPKAERAKRLLVPWAIWSGVYFVLKCIEALTTDSTLVSEFEPWMFLTGPNIHLWFLPFVFVFTVLFFNLEKHFRIILLLLTSMASYLVYNLTELGPPFVQWFSVWPAAAAGFLFRDTRNRNLIILLSSILFLLLMLTPLDRGALQLLICMVVVWLALESNVPSTEVSRYLSQLSLGIYLVHPAISSIAERIHIPDGLILFAFVCTCSTLFTAAARRWIPAAV